MPSSRATGPLTISSGVDVLVRRLHAAHVEVGIEHALDRGQHHRQVLRPAARHHGVGRDLLDGGDAPAAAPPRPAPRSAPRSVKASACFTRASGGRHDRQAVGPAAPQEQLAAPSSARRPRARPRCAGAGSRGERRPWRASPCSAARCFSVSSIQLAGGRWPVGSTTQRLPSIVMPERRAASSASPSAASRSWSSGSRACRCARTRRRSCAADRR